MSSLFWQAAVATSRASSCRFCTGRQCPVPPHSPALPASGHCTAPKRPHPLKLLHHPLLHESSWPEAVCIIPSGYHLNWVLSFIIKTPSMFFISCCSLCLSIPWFWRSIFHKIKWLSRAQALHLNHFSLLFLVS